MNLESIVSFSVPCFFSSSQPCSPPSRMSTGMPDLACSFAQPCRLATAFFYCVRGQDRRSLFNLSSVYPLLFLAAPSDIVSESLVHYLVCWPPPVPSLCLVRPWAAHTGSEGNGSHSCSSSALLVPSQCTAGFSLLSASSGGRESVVNFLWV